MHGLVVQIYILVFLQSLQPVDTFTLLDDINKGLALAIMLFILRNKNKYIKKEGWGRI